MKLTYNYLLLLLLALIIQNCENDNFDSQNDDIPSDAVFQSEHFGNSSIGNFIGLVTNELGESVPNVQITIGNVTTNTDLNGVFVLNNVSVFENFAYIKAFKEGYINGSRVVIPKTNGVNKIDIVLLKKEVTATVNSGENSNVSLSNGAKVSFNGDFISLDGSPYDGPVDVVLHTVSPNTASTFMEMPGSLFAQSASNDAVNLETYGMISVSLFSPSGEQLNIDENSPATIEFPINLDQITNAPETIPLWYFDEAVGYWKEDGQAIKVNNNYIGLVNHFTWWNFDVPFDYVNVCFSVTSLTIEASTTYTVFIKQNSNNQLIYSGSVLSQDGIECGSIPINEAITLSVYSQGVGCDFQLVHEEVLGGFSSDSNIDVSFNEELQTTTITGTITNCNGNPITNGYAFINQNNIYSITNGIINIGFQYCIPEPTNIKIFDFETGQWAFVNDIVLSGETVDLGSLSTCEEGGGTYNGDITLSTQAEVNEFGQFNYNRIAGDMRIGDFDGSNITDLTPLESLVTIDGNLSIFNATDLQSLLGLNNIEIIGNILTIIGNSALVSLTGLDSLTSISRLDIRNNESLETIGLNSITNISDSVLIIENDAMTTLEGLNNVTSINVLQLENNDMLHSINGFSSLTTLFRLRVFRNNSLTSFEGLESLTELDSLWVTSNQVLSSLNGLENVVTMTPSTGFPNILIGYGIETDVYGNYPNPNLTDFCALENLFVNGNGSSLQQGVHVTISNNAYNPSIQNIIDGDCSL